MTILNLMLGRHRGGLEQAALDYAEGLALANIPALTVISPNAWVATPLVNAGCAHETLANLGYWDPLAAWRLQRLAERTNARAVICHGNRALRLALKALKGRVPIIAVAHNYATHRFFLADHAFAITEHLKAHLETLGVSRISFMPNMVRMPLAKPVRAAYRTPPVIGALGRYDAKKGFDIYLHALAILKERGIPFHAVLAGAGAQEHALRTLAHECGLDGLIDFSGWVRDKAEFYEALDLFVLPSRQEAFGLTVIEAMAHGVPAIVSDIAGPLEIVGNTGLSFPRGDAEALAEKLLQLLNDEAYAANLAESAYARVKENYTREAMVHRLQAALAPYMVSHG